VRPPVFRISPAEEFLFSHTWPCGRHLSYSPFSASVDFGVIAPDGLFYGLNTTTGSFDKAIKVNQRGHYYFAVRNNSSETISVSGYVNY